MAIYRSVDDPGVRYNGYRCCWREEEPDEGPPHSGWWDFSNQSFEAPTEWQPLRAPAASADAVREALALAQKAISQLPIDALGYGEDDGGRWPLRDELLQSIESALTPSVAGADAGMRERLKSDWRRQIETVTGERETAECIVNLAELNGLFDALSQRPNTGGEDGFSDCVQEKVSRIRAIGEDARAALSPDATRS